MKIGFPASSIKINEKNMLSNSFVESGMIGIYNTDTKDISITNKESINKGLIEWMYENEIEDVITPEIKTMALKVFRDGGIEVYKSQGILLNINIELLKDDILLPYSFDETFKNKDGSCKPSSCGTCSSTSCK